MKVCVKEISLLVFCSLIFVPGLFSVQPDSIYQNFIKFGNLYSAGNFNEAERCMLSVLDANSELPEIYKIAAFNNLGLVKKSTGLYNEAIDYYNRAENIIGDREDMQVDLASVYNNKSRIYKFQRSYPTAIEYLEKSIRIYLGIKEKSRTILQNLSTAYMNLGIIYYETGNYNISLVFTEKSDSIKAYLKLPERELVFLNLAKIHYITGNIHEAGRYFERSLGTMEGKFGKDYYRISEVYFSYGDFLYETGKTAEALDAFSHALRIGLKNYGNIHPLVSEAYKKLGDYYLKKSDYGMSLEHYQKALIAIDDRFRDSDIMSNPSADSSLFDLNLLDILKNKSKALKLYAFQEDHDSVKIRYLKAGLMTSYLSFRLIEKIRISFPDEESRLYLSKVEKQTYTEGLKIAGDLLKITGDDSYKTTMFEIVQRAKAANLRNEISSREAFKAAGVPDSLQQRQTMLANSISAYLMLLSGNAENSQGRENSTLQIWKDELFFLNRQMEKLTDEISEKYPDYYDHLRKADPVPLSEIQSNLFNDETLVDYIVSEPDGIVTGEIYMFIVTGKKLEICEVPYDTEFQKKAEIIKNACQSPEYDNFRSFANALGYMYKTLIKPLEGSIRGDKIIIVPDGEISYLPFDAFISNDDPGIIRDFGGAEFLVRKYSISYSFSSSLILKKDRAARSGIKVFSFVPFYRKGPGDKIVRNNDLTGALIETGSIYLWFRGRKYEGSMATVDAFRKVMEKDAVFHLAMHSFSDTANSRYSYLQFWSPSPEGNGGRLFNYELGLSEMTSPMVVLSSCNSGSGRLYNGEGIISLARGFVLAGASSVVKTSWEVNDDVSAEIVTRYYKGLSEGRRKDEALRLAKLDYLRNTSPNYNHPYYWASYELTGDNSPLVTGHKNYVLIISILGITAVLIIVFYLRRRSIFSDSRT